MLYDVGLSDTVLRKELLLQFLKKNPKTGSFAFILIMVLSIVLGIVLIIKNNIQNKFYKI